MEVAGIRQVTPEEALEMTSGGAILLDVREADERERFRAPDSIHIPLMQIPDRWAELPQDTPIVAVCAAGGRSQQAAMFLQDQGLEVVNLVNGMQGWFRMGLPVVTGPA